MGDSALTQRTHSTASPAEALDAATISKADYEALAAFRYSIRRFVRESEQAARQEGVTPQQHQLLLAIKGFPGRDHATITELADRMQMRLHSVVGLVDRTEALGLVHRAHDTADRRQVFVSLTPAGEATLSRLTSRHRAELRHMRDTLTQVR